MKRKNVRILRLSSMYTMAMSKGMVTTGFNNGRPRNKNKYKGKPYTDSNNKNPILDVVYNYRPNMGFEFYLTNEWRLLRSRVIKKYGFKCLRCGKEDRKIHVDHIKPRSKYPHLELVFNNLQVLCKSCNYSKSNLYETDYRKK